MYCFHYLGSGGHVHAKGSQSGVICWLSLRLPLIMANMMGLLGYIFDVMNIEIVNVGGASLTPGFFVFGWII